MRRASHERRASRLRAAALWRERVGIIAGWRRCFPARVCAHAVTLPSPGLLKLAPCRAELTQQGLFDVVEVGQHFNL